MSNFTQAPIVTAAQIFSSSATQQHQLGTFARTRDGRGFRYARAGAALHVVGDVLQAPAQVTAHQNLTPTAAQAVGSKTIIATLGAAAAAVDLYAEGFAVIDTAPGHGYQYAISGHAAVASAGVITLNLFADDPIQVALTTASRVTLQQNPYKHVIQSPTTATGAVVGVSVHPIPANEYGWVQTHGPSGVLIEATATAAAVGTPVRPSAVTAGAAEALVVTTATAIPAGILGHMLVTGVDGRVQPVFLTID